MSYRLPHDDKNLPSREDEIWRDEGRLKNLNLTEKDIDYMIRNDVWYPWALIYQSRADPSMKEYILKNLPLKDLIEVRCNDPSFKLGEVTKPWFDKDTDLSQITTGCVLNDILVTDIMSFCEEHNKCPYLPFLSDLKSLTLYDVEEITKYWIKKGCPESTWCYATLLQRFPYTTYPTQYVNLHVYMCDRTIDIKVPPCFLLVALKHFELNIEEKMSFYVKEKEEELSEFTFIRDLPDDEDGTKYVFILPS